MTPIPLADLITALPAGSTLTGDPATPISAPVVESDADLLPGGVFVARRGLTTDGHTFIGRAIARGAAAIVGERPFVEVAPLPVPYLQVADSTAAVGYLAAGYHRHPSRRLTVIGVTGTDGKTTTSTILHTILQRATGGKTGLISTVSAVIGDETLDTGLHVTTPGAPLIQALLARMVAAGLTHVILEMTSHGLAQGRLNSVDIDIAVLTNLTHEHLDYHGSFDAYRAAKGRMFAMLSIAARKPNMPKIAILNADDANAEYFAAFPADRHLTYALDRPADVRGTDIVHRPGYTQFRAAGDLFHLPLVGVYNVRNALAAITAARALGIDTETLQAGIVNVPVIPGRMERIDDGQAYTALVDFAHTPNALENALRAARDLAGTDGGKVIVIFGSAGLRDRDKRALMARAAIQFADLAIITAEDPRTESLADILATMSAAAEAAGGVEGQTFHRIPDRGAALFYACSRARVGDVVIACGKGHEQSMCFGTIEYAWDDRAALRAAISGLVLSTLPTAEG